MPSNENPASWHSASVPPVLRQSEIHVWRIPLAADNNLKTDWILLSSSELQRASEFKLEPARRSFVTRRTALREILGGYLNIAPPQIELPSGSHGKPHLADPSDPFDLRFNCSHSGNWALVAVTRGWELGVDIEAHKDLPERLELAERYFSRNEYAALARLDPAEQTNAFFRCWTRKEAFIKAIGLGLSFPLDGFSVSLSPGEPAALKEVVGDPAAVAKWSMASFEVAPQYSAAIVYGGQGATIRLFEWRP